MNRSQHSSTEVGRAKPKRLTRETIAAQPPYAEADNRRSVRKQTIVVTDEAIERLVAPAAIERALSVYRQMKKCDRSVILQARKILTQRIYALVDQGEKDEQRLTVGGLVHLKSIERDHAIKSASDFHGKKQP